MTAAERWKAVLERNSTEEALREEEALKPLGAPGEVLGMKCVEPGCTGILRLMWSDRVQRYWYSCSHWPACKGSMPAEADGAPRGKPRTRALQEQRVRTHEVFDVLWKKGHCSRGTAYAWFRRVMVLTPDKAHIYKLDIEGCEKLIRMVREKGPGTEFWRSWYNPGKRTKPGPSSKRRRRSSGGARR